MPTFHGGMREQADHNRPWVRLRLDRQSARLGPWLPFMRRSIPTYIMPWSQVERIEPLTDRYLSGAAVRFVLRSPVAALEGPPNAAHWPAAQQPVFLCGSARRLKRVLAALPSTLAPFPQA
jgi:hypothetical protein